MPKLKEELQFTSLDSIIRPKEGVSLYYKDGVMKLLHANGTEESIFTGSGSIDLSQYYTKTEVDNLINSLSPNGFEVLIVESLPATGESGKLYLLKDEGKDTYTEYLYVNSKWEVVGSTNVDLSGYALKSEIPTNLSDLTNDIDYATNSQLELKANSSDVYTKEEVSLFVNQKANVSDVYSKTEVYNKTEVNDLLAQNSGGTTVVANPVLDGGEGILESIQIEDTKYSLQGQSMTFSESPSTSVNAKPLKTIKIDSDEWKVETGSIVIPNVELTGTEGILESVDIDGTAFTLKGEEMVFSETAVAGATVLKNIKIGNDNWAIPEPGNVDLSNYYTKTEIDNKVETLDNVVANPVLDGTESELTAISINDTKYSLYGNTLVLNDEVISGASNLKSLTINGDSWNISSDLSDYYTKTEIDSKGYLTQHQSLENYYNKTEIDSLIKGSDLSNYYNKTESDERYLSSTGGTINGSIQLIGAISAKSNSALTYDVALQPVSSLFGALMWCNNGSEVSSLRVWPDRVTFLSSGKQDLALATESYVNNKIADLVNSAPEALDTLGELATALQNHEDAYGALLTTVGNKADVSALTTHTGNSNIHVTSEEKAAWNNKVDQSQLDNYATQTWVQEQLNGIETLLARI